MPLADLVNSRSEPKFLSDDGEQQGHVVESGLKTTGCKNMWDEVSLLEHESKGMRKGGLDVEVLYLGIKIIERQVERHCGSTGKNWLNSRS